jgi:hypothetical protein
MALTSLMRACAALSCAFAVGAFGASPAPSWEWVSADVDGGQSPNATGAPLHMALDSKKTVGRSLQRAAPPLPPNLSTAILSVSAAVCELLPAELINDCIAGGVFNKC